MAEVTNYIDRLVAELCPDGVEYRPLESLGKRNKGTAITASKMRSLEPGKKDLRIFAAGSTFVDTDSSNIPAKDILHGPAIIVKSRGYIGFEYYEKSFTHKNEMWSYTLDSNIVNQKFIYYYLLTQAYYLQELARSKSVKLPQLAVKDTDSLEVPVPPLEIQEAIVEILDKFTNLEAELEAELEARTLQYEYYRDSLFEALDCPRATLGELGKFYGGLKGKTKNDFGSSGARYISYKNVYENISTDFTWPDFVQVKEGENQLSLMKGDILLTGSSENMEESGLSSVVTKEPGEKAYLNSFSICYRLNDPSILNPEFSKYLFRSRLARKQIIRTAQGVTRFNVSKKKLANVTIPIPSLEEQQRIVDILDRFDALTTSLSEGLPAELAARRSQYEYYRDQLLTFPRKGENQ
ncbi:restriction endonuclease subunit S [uncultured Rothia sp.]|uniref:restriction endonuclease subunit S n=1 Tax=uncultured Rothia sp. TaxID=316088 RepID=UPI0025E1E79E|nr:restriction endonuclease subunit S [uncultured Rothia sp.]